MQIQVSQDIVAQLLLTLTVMTGWVNPRQNRVEELYTLAWCSIEVTKLEARVHRVSGFSALSGAYSQCI